MARDHLVTTNAAASPRLERGGPPPHPVGGERPSRPVFATLRRGKPPALQIRGQRQACALERPSPLSFLRNPGTRVVLRASTA